MVAAESGPLNSICRGKRGSDETKLRGKGRLDVRTSARSSSRDLPTQPQSAYAPFSHACVARPRPLNGGRHRGMERSLALRIPRYLDQLLLLYDSNRRVRPVLFFLKSNILLEDSSTGGLVNSRPISMDVEEISKVFPSGFTLFVRI